MLVMRAVRAVSVTATMRAAGGRRVGASDGVYEEPAIEVVIAPFAEGLGG
jgi:hypothetical protein